VAPDLRSQNLHVPEQRFVYGHASEEIISAPRLKTGTDNRLQLTTPRRAEFFALPIMGQHRPVAVSPTRPFGSPQPALAT
jgi:hypothetical protein